MFIKKNVQYTNTVWQLNFFCWYFFNKCTAETSILYIAVKMFFCRFSHFFCETV